MDDDFEEETIEGEVVDVRGPAWDGSYELDIKQEDQTVVTVTVSAIQYQELLRELKESNKDSCPTPPHLLN